MNEWNRVWIIQIPGVFGMRVLKANEIAKSLWLIEAGLAGRKKITLAKGNFFSTIVENNSKPSEVANLKPNKTLDIQWEQFSSWRKLFNTLAYLLRWRNRNLTNGSISLEKYQKVEHIIFKRVQKEAFSVEYQALTVGKELSSKSHIAQFCPSIDSHGIIRALGALSGSDFECDKKLPILLPSKHPAIQLMMLKCRMDNLHQGIEGIQHDLKQNFCVLGLWMRCEASKVTAFLA